MMWKVIKIMNKKYQLVIFDLDGTLLNTSKGIYNSVRYAEKELKLKPIDDDLLKEFVGPPPKLMYMKHYALSEEEALAATKKHREYGRTKAIFEAQEYPEMKKTLMTLRNKGYKLAVATLKSQDIAETILFNFGLKEYFDCILGMDGEEKLTKSMIIKKAIEKCECSGKAVMIGDSENDFIGANEAGIDFIGVTYGFGYSKDIVKNSTFLVSDSPDKILELV